MTALWVILGTIVGGVGALFLIALALPGLLANMIKNIDGPPKEHKWRR